MMPVSGLVGLEERWPARMDQPLDPGQPWRGDANDPRQPLDADAAARNQARQHGRLVPEHHLDREPGDQQARDRRRAGEEAQHCHDQEGEAKRAPAELRHQPGDRDGGLLLRPIQHPREADRRGDIGLRCRPIRRHWGKRSLGIVSLL